MFSHTAIHVPFLILPVIQKEAVIFIQTVIFKYLRIVAGILEKI